MSISNSKVLYSIPEVSISNSKVLYSLQEVSISNLKVFYSIPKVSISNSASVMRIVSSKSNAVNYLSDTSIVEKKQRAR